MDQNTEDDTSHERNLQQALQSVKATLLNFERFNDSYIWKTSYVDN